MNKRIAVKASSIVLTLCMLGCMQPTQQMVSSSKDRNWLNADAEAIGTAKIMADPQILPQTHFAAALLHEQNGQFDDALVQYKKSAATNHNYVEAYARMGLLLGRMGRHAEAESALSKAVQLDPGSARLRNNLGYEYALQGRWMDAETELRNAVQLDPRFARSFVNLGMVIAKQHRFEEALEAFKTALAEEDAFYNLGLMYHSGHRYAEAAEAYEHVLSLNPEFTAAQRQLNAIAPKLAQVVVMQPEAEVEAEITEEPPIDKTEPTLVKSTTELGITPEPDMVVPVENLDEVVATEPAAEVEPEKSSQPSPQEEALVLLEDELNQLDPPLIVSTGTSAIAAGLNRLQEAYEAEALCWEEEATQEEPSCEDPAPFEAQVISAAAGLQSDEGIIIVEEAVAQGEVHVADEEVDEASMLAAAYWQHDPASSVAALPEPIQVEMQQSPVLLDEEDSTILLSSELLDESSEVDPMEDEPCEDSIDVQAGPGPVQSIVESWAVITEEAFLASGWSVNGRFSDWYEDSFDDLSLLPSVTQGVTSLTPVIEHLWIAELPEPAAVTVDQPELLAKETALVEPVAVNTSLSCEMPDAYVEEICPDQDPIAAYAQFAQSQTGNWEFLGHSGQWGPHWSWYESALNIVAQPLPLMVRLTAGGQ